MDIHKNYAHFIEDVEKKYGCIVRECSHLSQNLKKEENDFKHTMGKIEEHLMNNKYHVEKHVGKETHDVKKGLIYMECALAKDMDYLEDVIESFGEDKVGVAFHLISYLADIAVEEGLLEL